MRKKSKAIVLILIILAALAVVVWYLRGRNIAILEPAGQVGAKERGLIVFGVLLSIIVVVPTFALTIFIALKYRESNHENSRKKIKYNPDWDHSKLFESIWWGIPIVIIGVLSVVTWNSAHALDPWKTLSSSKKPITVQVVSLDWKWLFIYPDQHIASVNLVEFPKNTPVNFEITSDTVMNSFWVPNLGGQIYSMPGMSTELHLMASKAGSWPGSSANISGSGFSGMTFTAKAATHTNFDKWVQMVQKSPNPLSMDAYKNLAKASKNNPVAYYSTPASNLYDTIIMKYMMPSNEMPSMYGGGQTQTESTPAPPSSNMQNMNMDNSSNDSQMQSMPGMNMQNMDMQ